jgi:hypothetical protein
MLKKILLCVMLAGPAHAVDFSETDKQKHVGASFLISTVAYAALRNSGRTSAEAALGAVALTLAVGMVKELSDSHVDREDLEADAIGAIAAPLLFWTF